MSWLQLSIVTLQAKTIYSCLFDWYALVIELVYETSGVCPHDAKLQLDTLIHCLDYAHF
jgi:hypothetical protein